MDCVDISVVIPSCDRAPILLDTIRQLLALDEPAREIIVVDQSTSIDAHSGAALDAHQRCGDIRWVRRTERNIPAALNLGVQIARGTVILFLDDDVRIECELVQAHLDAHHAVGGPLSRRGCAAIVAGQVIQPWQRPLADNESGYPSGMQIEPDSFRFNACRAEPVRRFMGGNVSIRRDAIIMLGGFDENFVGAAYRFEADFSQRLHDHGFEIYFQPMASIYHIKAAQGGTRSFAHYLAPWHSTGRYYYLMKFPRTPGLWRVTTIEALRSIATRRHLRAPWRVLSSACAEISGFLLAAYHRIRGPRLPLRRLH